MDSLCSFTFRIFLLVGFIRSSFALQHQYPAGNYGPQQNIPGNNQNQFISPTRPAVQYTGTGFFQPSPAASNPNRLPNGYPNPITNQVQNPVYLQPPQQHNQPRALQPGEQPPQVANPAIPFFKPKARCECYIATMAGNNTNELLDLLLPFGTSQTLTTDRTDTTCRELQNQCNQHCRIQKESCLMDGLRSIVPNSNPPISYGSYACKTVTKDDMRHPAGVFYALNAMYCKDEGFIDRLQEQYCCTNFRHPFLPQEQLRLFSPNCSASLSSCDSVSTLENLNSTTTNSPTTPPFDNDRIDGDNGTDTTPATSFGVVNSTAPVTNEISLETTRTPDSVVTQTNATETGGPNSTEAVAAIQTTNSFDASTSSTPAETSSPQLVTDMTPETDGFGIESSNTQQPTGTDIKGRDANPSPVVMVGTTPADAANASSPAPRVGRDLTSTTLDSISKETTTAAEPSTSAETKAAGGLASSSPALDFTFTTASLTLNGSSTVFSTIQSGVTARPVVSSTRSR